MTEAAVTLYQFPRAGRLESLSPFCVKVHLVLNLKGIDYQVKDVMSPGQVKRVNRRGRLPAADLNGQRVVDSSDIIAAIEKRWPTPALRPTGRVEQARARILEDWADEVLYFYLVYWRWQVEPPDPGRAFKAVPRLLRPLVYWLVKRTVKTRLKHQGFGLKPPDLVEAELKGAFDAIEACLEGTPGPYLLGEQLTTADIAVFAQVDGFWWQALPRASALLEGYSALSDWYDAVDAATRQKAGRKGRTGANGCGTPLPVTVRREGPLDRAAVRAVNEAAFPSAGEATLVERLREEVGTLSLVAVHAGRVVGHAFFTPVQVEHSDGAWEAMALGPMAVLPEYQRRGVGSRLVEAGLAACRDRGEAAIFVLGHPAYYPRFGFQPAPPLGFQCDWEVPDEVFMVRALRPDALVGRSGQVRYQPAFYEV